MDIITVYFFYGLSFFSMGLAVLLEVDRSSKLDFARALAPLAAFGLIHGSHEWLEMFLLIHTDFKLSEYYQFVAPVRIILLAASFFCLISFGARLIVGPKRNALHWKLLMTIAIIWAAGLTWVFSTEPQPVALVAADVYTRYSLAIPGAALAAWGLVLQRHHFFGLGMERIGYDVVIAAIAFGLYGGVGQLFVAPSPIFPSNYLNAPVFQAWTGFPIQFFRTMMACTIAIFIIRSLRAFEEENRAQIESMREAQLAERKRMEEVRVELLRRTVRAQESERQRIARELHDELGQTLTAIGLGLRAIVSNAASKPEKVEKQAQKLETLVDGGLSGLQNLIMGLHPPQLDDFGLVSALRWYAREIEGHTRLAVEVTCQGAERELAVDVRIVLYRICQEAISNILRHAQIGQARVDVIFLENEVNIRIEDDGCGFDVNKTLETPQAPSWGLRLAHGSCPP